MSWTCDLKDRTPNMDITKDGGVPGGYVCSRGMADEMNAIINGCRPYLHQNVGDYCGQYIIDLSENNNFAESRNIKALPVNSSCTYRAFSTCGFPEMKFRINNDKIQEDFDIAYASKDGLQLTNDLDGWEWDLKTDWNNSLMSNKTQEYTVISQAANSNQIVTDDQWKTCHGKARNLWVTVTRVKNSSAPAVEAESDSFLAVTPRMLQYYPNGSWTNDIDLMFTNIRGGASIVGVFSVAFAAGLAALAF